MGDTVVFEVGADLPLGDRRVLPVGPRPAAVQVARFGADADAAEVRVVVDVDGEPMSAGALKGFAIAGLLGPKSAVPCCRQTVDRCAGRWRGSV